MDTRRSHILITDGAAIVALNSHHQMAREITFDDDCDLWRVDYSAEQDVYVVIERAGSRGARERVCVLDAVTGAVVSHIPVPGDSPMLCSRFLSMTAGVLILVDQFSYCQKEMSLSGELLTETDLRTAHGFSSFTGACVDGRGRVLVSTVGLGVARFWQEGGEGGTEECRWEGVLSLRHLDGRHLISVCPAPATTTNTTTDHTTTGTSTTSDKLFVVTGGDSPKYKLSCFDYV